MRTFESGATRDDDAGKLDYEGFLSPLVLRRYAEYLHQHRIQADGNLRDSDNWQRGIPVSVYMKSAWRHFLAWWTAHRGMRTDEPEIEDSICALIFNAAGYLHRRIEAKRALADLSSDVTKPDCEYAPVSFTPGDLREAWGIPNSGANVPNSGSVHPMHAEALRDQDETTPGCAVPEADDKIHGTFDVDLTRSASFFTADGVYHVHAAPWRLP